MDGVSFHAIISNHYAKANTKALCVQVDLKSLERAIGFSFSFDLFPNAGRFKLGVPLIENAQRWQKGQKN
jgi:hypothetical protein